MGRSKCRWEGGGDIEEVGRGRKREPKDGEGCQMVSGERAGVKKGANDRDRKSKDKERERTGHNGTKVYTDENSCGDSKTGSIMTK